MKETECNRLTHILMLRRIKMAQRAGPVRGTVVADIVFSIAFSLALFLWVLILLALLGGV